MPGFSRQLDIFKDNIVHWNKSVVTGISNMAVCGVRANYYADAPSFSWYIENVTCDGCRAEYSQDGRES